MQANSQLSNHLRRRLNRATLKEPLSAVSNEKSKLFIIFFTSRRDLAVPEFQTKFQQPEFYEKVVYSSRLNSELWRAAPAAGQPAPRFADGMSSVVILQFRK